MFFACFVVFFFSFGFETGFLSRVLGLKVCSTKKKRCYRVAECIVGETEQWRAHTDLKSTCFSSGSPLKYQGGVRTWHAGKWSPDQYIFQAREAGMDAGDRGFAPILTKVTF